MSDTPKDKVQLISINDIRVINPRDRGVKKFKEIVDSIASVGLKRPITVSRASGKESKKRFNLVCGQGRLEAFKALEQAEIPAIVIDASKEECYLMSLVENLARRKHTSLELMHDIGALTERGYTPLQIAEKTGLKRDYVYHIQHLLQNGEERLIAAVEKDRIPITVAVTIANTDDKDIQQALTEAYERNELRGSKLKIARDLVHFRQVMGKELGHGTKGKPRKKEITADAMVRAYKKETKRQRTMIKKSDLTESRLMFLVSSLRDLFGDENFITLLRAEGLDTVPSQIVDLIGEKGVAG